MTIKAGERKIKDAAGYSILDTKNSFAEIS